MTFVAVGVNPNEAVDLFRPIHKNTSRGDFIRYKIIDMKV